MHMCGMKKRMFFACKKIEVEEVFYIWHMFCRIRTRWYEQDS